MGGDEHGTLQVLISAGYASSLMPGLLLIVELPGYMELAGAHVECHGTNIQDFNSHNSSCKSEKKKTIHFWQYKLGVHHFLLLLSNI